jgi:ABC-2 type transport system permease protein
MIRVELALLVWRRRTWASVVALAAVPVLIAVVLKVSKVAPPPGEGPAFLSEVLNNGTVFPLAALGIVLPVFLPVAVLMLAGDSVAGDASTGTLRYLLIRPVGRGRLLMAKMAAIVSYLLLAVGMVTVIAFCAGWLLFGLEPVQTLSNGPPLPVSEACFRILLAGLYISASMLGVATIGLYLSVKARSGLAATLGALSVLVTAGVLDQLAAADAAQPFLPTHYWLAFVDLFRDPILWYNMQRGLAVQAAYVTVMFSLAWATFAAKDITS